MNNSSSNPSDSSNLGNYGSETASIDDFSVGGAELSRAQRLEENKKYKQDLLSRKSQFSSLDNSYTELEDGTIESNRNKTWNDLGDQEFQDLFNYTVNNKVLTPNEDGTTSFSDGTPYQGRTRRVYMYGSKGEGNEAVKLGIARGDLDSSKLRYTPNEETGYGWESGSRGVDTNKEYLDILVPENVAKMIESVGHGRMNALEGRAVKDLYTRTVEDKFPSFEKLQEPQQESADATPEIDGLFGKALSSIASTRGWNPQDANNLIDFMGKVAEIESNGIVDRKQSDSEDGIGRGKYQFETSKGSGASKTAANRLFRGLPKLGIDVNEIPEADRAELASDDPDFSKLSEDVQDLAFLVDKAEAGGVDLTAIAKGEISAADAWLTTHWKGSEEEAPSKLAMWQERFGNEEPTSLGTDVVEAEVPVTPTTEEDPFLANIKETLEAYKDFQEPITREQLGSGSSEYYVNKEALFGKEGEYNEESGKKLFKQYIRDLDKKGRIQDVVDVEADRAARYQANRRWMAENANAVDQTLNTLQGFGATFVGELLVNPLDAIGDITGAYDLGTEEEKSEYLNEAFGYNPEAAAMAMEEIGKQWDIAANSELSAAERARAAGTGILEAFTTPEMLGTSLGALLAWVSPGKVFTMLGKGTKYADTVNRIDKLADAGKLTKQSARAKKVKAFTSLDGAKSLLTKQSGFIASALGNVNNQYEEFVQNNNGVELTGAEKAKFFAGRFAVQMVNQNLDKFTDVSIIKNPGLITAIVPAIKSMTNKEFAATAKVLGKGVGKSLENMGKEAAQEYTQTMMELFNSRFGSAQFKNVEEFTDFITDERNTREAGIASLAGAGGSQQFEVVGSIGPAVGLVSQGAVSAGKKITARKTGSSNVVTPKETDLSTPIVTETEESISTEDLTATETEAYTKAAATVEKYANMFNAEELVATTEKTDGEKISTPNVAEAIDDQGMSYADVIAEIEQAETALAQRKEKNPDLDIAAPFSILKQVKEETARKIITSDKKTVLGSGYSPEDIVEDFLDSKTNNDGVLNVSEDEKTLVNKYLKANGVKPFRFENVQARLEGKDAKSVYDDSMAEGRNSATSRRARLKTLVNTPGVSKSQVKKEVVEIENFLTTQKNRKEAYEATRAEVQLDVTNYNKNRKDPAKAFAVPKGKNVEGLKDKFIAVKKQKDGSYAIHENSKAILTSLDDTIDHLETTLTRYKKATTGIIGEATVSSSTLAVPASANVSKGVKKNREDDAAFYEKTKPTKVIIDKDTSLPKWSKGKEYYALNESKIAKPSTITKDDVILLTTLEAKRGSSVSKLLDAASKAGASIVVDSGLLMRKSKQGKEVSTLRRVRALAKRYGMKFVTDKNGIQKMLPLAEAEAVTKENEQIQKAKDKKSTANKKLVEAYTAIFLAAEENKKVSPEAFKALRVAKAYAKEFYNKETAEKDMKAHARTAIKKEAEALEASLSKIMIEKGIDSKEYAEKVAELNPNKLSLKMAEKSVKQKADRLSKGGKLVSEWKAAQKKAKSGLSNFADWLKETFGESDKKVGKDMLDNSIGKNESDTRVSRGVKIKDIYSYIDKTSGNFRTTAYLKDVELNAVDGVYNVLESDPTKYVEIGESTIFNTLNIEEISIEGEEGVLFNSFVEDSLDVVSGALKSPVLKDQTIPFDLIDSPADTLVYDKDGKLNSNFAVAVRIALYSFVRNNNFLLSKEGKSLKDLADILGKHPAELDQKAIDAMKGHGLMVKTAADSLGKDIAKLMGFKRKANNEVDAQAYDALITNFGQIALVVGQTKEEGLFKETSMPSAKFARDVLGKADAGIVESEGTVNFINLQKNENADMAIFTIDALDNSIPDLDARRKEPLFRKPTDKEKKKASAKIKKEKLGVDIAADSKKSMDLSMDTEMSADMTLAKVVTTPANKERIKKLLGHVPLEDENGNPHPDFLKLSHSEQQVQPSKNRDIEKSIEHIEWLESESTPKNGRVSMWFKYFFSKNGRFFIDSNTINPQTDKHLHRFLVQPLSHVNNFITKGRGGKRKFYVDGKDVTDLVHYSIAQGLGFATDKKSFNQIKAFSTNILANITSADKLTAVQEAFLDSGKVKTINLATGKQSKEVTLDIEMEHLGHALQAFDFIGKAIKNKPFDSAISAEFDAVTSGFGLKLLQMPILKNIHTWLRKVGIVRISDTALSKIGDQAPSMNNLLASEGFLDSYQQLASSIKSVSYATLKDNSKSSLFVSQSAYTEKLWNSVSKVLPSVQDDGSISSSLRSLFKYPFMTFNYASSIKSIRTRLKTTMQEDISKNIAAINLDSEKFTKEEQAVVDMLMAYLDSTELSAAKALQEEVRTKPLSLVGVKKGTTGSVSLGKYLEEMIDASYGVQVENTLTKEFQPFVAMQEDINKGFRALFEVFKVTYEDSLTEARKKGAVSAEKERELYKAALDQWPAIKGPLARMEEEFSSEGAVGIYSLDTASPYGIYSGRKAPTTKVSEKMKKVVNKDSLTTSHMIKQLSYALSAGSVVPIHYIDGAVMSSAITDLDGEVTSIHDAIIPSLLNIDKGQKAYNKAVIELGTSYNYPNELMKALDRVLDKTKITNSESKTKYQTTKITFDVDGDKQVVPVSEFVISTRNSLATSVNQINRARKQLVNELNKGAYVMHMAGTADGVYAITEDNPIQYEEIAEYPIVNNAILADIHSAAQNLCK